MFLEENYVFFYYPVGKLPTIFTDQRPLKSTKYEITILTTSIISSNGRGNGNLSLNFSFINTLVVNKNIIAIKAIINVAAFVLSIT